MPACAAWADRIETYLKFKEINEDSDRCIAFLCLRVRQFFSYPPVDFPAGQ